MSNYHQGFFILYKISDISINITIKLLAIFNDFIFDFIILQILQF